MISCEILGRPGCLQFLLPSYFWAMSLWYHANTVSGVNRTVVCFQEFSGQLFGLRGQPHPLVVVKQDTFVLFLLFLQDPDLLLEVLDSLPEFLVQTISQTRHYRKPKMPFHSPQRLTGRGAAGKGCRQIVAKSWR